MSGSPAQLYCIRTANGDFVCEITDGPIYDYRSVFQMYEVRAVKGKLNPINRMVVPEWKLSNRVAAARDNAEALELEGATA